jgi:hypothetical protein
MELMKFIGGFFQFARRVISAAKSGGLGGADMQKLDSLLERTGKRNTIVAKGILSALSAGGAGEKDISRFGELLAAAEARIGKDKEPFTKTEKEELQGIFKRAYLSDRTARWFSGNIDALLAEELNEFISGARRVDIGVPARKSVRVGREEDEDRKRRMKS